MFTFVKEEEGEGGVALLILSLFSEISHKNEIIWSQAKLFHFHGIFKNEGEDFGSATSLDLAIFTTFVILGINVLMQVMIKLIDSYCSPNCF